MESLLQNKEKDCSSIRKYLNLLSILVLILAWIAGFFSRLFSVIRYESIIHEFDPWFNYRATRYMVEKGLYEFWNWFDERAWFPLGRIVGGTTFPGLMLTSGFIHKVLHLLSIPVHIQEICVFLAPLFSGLTAIATYLLTKELWNHGAALLAASFIAIVPGYITRSVAGSYDNEGIAIFALMFTYFLWIKSMKTGSILWSTFTALSYCYMVSAWGGYVYIINLIPLHVFVLMILGKYSSKIYTSYVTFYVLGTLLSMQVPFVGFQPIKTSEHMAAAGAFVLCNAYSLMKFLQNFLTKVQFKFFFCSFALVIPPIIFFVVCLLTYLGVIAPWTGRFYSLWDTNYAKIHIPIIASVSEHQPTSWGSYFLDTHVLVCFFPAGIWYLFMNWNPERVFVILFGLSAVYFASVMVRLILTVTPVICVCAAISFSQLLTLYLSDDSIISEDTVSPSPSSSILKSENIFKNKALKGDSEKLNSSKKVNFTYQSTSLVDSKNSQSLYDKPDVYLQPKDINDASAKIVNTESATTGVSPNVKSLVIVAIILLLMMFVVHCTWITASAYSNPSVILAYKQRDGSRVIIDDFREAYFWLRKNTHEDATVMSWWDYGYQIAGFSNRTTIVDNNTWNNSHIALVGKAMSSNEEDAYKIVKMLDVNYVLVIFGGLIGFSGDDINKFLWMVRIAQGEHPNDIKERDYFSKDGSYRVDNQASATMLNCLMYKLSYYKFGAQKIYGRSGFDNTRNSEIGNANFNLRHFEEVFTSDNWLVRIYRVKDYANRGSASWKDYSALSSSPSLPTNFRTLITSKKANSNTRGKYRIPVSS